MMKKKCALLTVLAVVVCNGFAALDLNPAPWRTNPAGLEPTTYQSWDFPTNANPVFAEVDQNPYGTAELAVVGDFFDNTVYFDQYNGHDGVWGFESEINIMIPNNPIRNPYKEMWIQITYRSDEGNPPIFYALPEGVQPYHVMDLKDVVDLQDGYYHATYHLVIEPNPSMEISIVRPADCTLYVDDLIVETICDVPEPMTLILLGLGGALLRGKK